jgi:hypothetical protein
MPGDNIEILIINVSSSNSVILLKVLVTLGCPKMLFLLQGASSIIWPLVPA